MLNTLRSNWPAASMDVLALMSVVLKSFLKLVY